jgi:hypothetical protein
MLALVFNGQVVQLEAASFPVNPALVWVDVSTITPAPQCGWAAAETSGIWAFTPPPGPPAPTPYAAFIAGGLTVTSAGTPALNGVYAIDAQTQTDISTEAQFVSTFSEFTNGTATNLSWPLASGTLVTFPTTAAFMSFAKVAAQTVAAAKLAAAQGASLPSAAVSIP